MSALEKFSEEQEIEFYHSANDIKNAIRKYGIAIVAFCMEELAEELLSKSKDEFDLTTVTHSGTMVIQ